MYDIVIVGQSYIGKLTALNLSKAFPHIKLCIIDKHTPTIKTPDHRATALSQSSINLLNTLSLWESLQASSAPIHEIQIGLNTTEVPLILHQDSPPLGYNILNAHLTSAIDEKLQALPNIHYYHGHALKHIVIDTAKATVTLDNNTHIAARLIIGADGRFSGVRSLLTSVRTINYNHTALTGTVHHDAPHKNRAFEFFIPQGPLAFIPLQDPHTSTFVWSLKNALLPPTDSIQPILSNLMQSNLGKVYHASPVQRFPLNAYIANQRAGHRWVLLGDAANAIHPVAGQGMNLAIRDVTTLIDHLSHQFNLGLDLGSHTHLSQYAKSRQIDRYLLICITHVSAQWLTTPLSPVRSALNKGMELFDTHSILSNIAINSASLGVSGNPRERK